MKVSTCSSEYIHGATFFDLTVLNRTGLIFSLSIYRCAACYKCFLTSNKLKYHIRRTHLPIESGTFDCTVCDKKCKNLRLLLNHQKSHIQIVCTHCKKQISASNYEQHVRTIHTVGVVTKKRKTVGKNDAAANKKKKIDEKNAPSSSSTPKQSQISSMSHKVSPIQVSQFSSHKLKLFKRFYIYNFCTFLGICREY